MIERTVYVSRAAEGIGPREVYEIIRRAHNRNGQLGLTARCCSSTGTSCRCSKAKAGACASASNASPPMRATGRWNCACRARWPNACFPTTGWPLRLRDEIDPALLQRFGYQPGLPAAAFDGQKVLQFVQACCATVAAQVAAGQT